MNRNFFESEHLCIRAMETADLDFIYTMENDPGCWDVSNFSVPYSRRVLLEYIENSQSDLFADRQVRLIVTLKSTGEAIGTVDLTDFSGMHRHGEIGIALLKAYRGKGLSQEALLLMENYAFVFLHMKHLLSRVLSTNLPSLNLFLGCGYRKVGVLTSWWQTPEGFQDVILLEKVCP